MQNLTGFYKFQKFTNFYELSNHGPRILVRWYSVWEPCTAFLYTDTEYVSGSLAGLVSVDQSRKCAW